MSGVGACQPNEVDFLDPCRAGGQAIRRSGVGANCASKVRVSLKKAGEKPWRTRRVACYVQAMRVLARLGLGCLLLGLVACGGKASSEGSAGNEGEGGSGSAGRGAGGTSSGGQGRAGTSGAGGMADTCAAFDDEAGTFVSVLIRNETSAPIYLGQSMVTCGIDPFFSVVDSGGAPLPQPGGCRVSCLLARTQGVGGCPAICAFPSSIQLEPGETLQTSWDGLFQVQGSLPGSCTSFESPSATVSCDQAKRISAGTFTFSARAGTAIDCSQTTGAGQCSPCTEIGNGGCSTPGSLVGGKILSTSASILLDESYGIESRPGAPGAGAAPGSDVNVAPQVLLVFTE